MINYQYRLVILTLTLEEQFISIVFEGSYGNGMKYTSANTISFPLQYSLKINRFFMQILMDIVFLVSLISSNNLVFLLLGVAKREKQ